MAPDTRSRERGRLLRVDPARRDLLRDEPAPEDRRLLLPGAGRVALCEGIQPGPRALRPRLHRARRGHGPELARARSLHASPAAHRARSVAEATPGRRAPRVSADTFTAARVVDGEFRSDPRRLDPPSRI